MLGYLQGKILSKSHDNHTCTLLSHRIGFEIIVSKRHFEQIKEGEKTSLWIHTHVREDALTLFGFSSEREKVFFRLLLTVSGLGPKIALSLLSEFGTSEIAKHIRLQDANSLSQAPGIGKKLAQRILLDLSSKIEKMIEWEVPLTKTEKISTASFSAEDNLRENLFSALLNLGYQNQPIKNVLDRILEDSKNADFESHLKSALKELSHRPVISKEGSLHG
jgi:Holliday junction DNA helicase RuvA